MKVASFTLCMVFGAILAMSGVNGSSSEVKDNTITKVVKLLQKMMKKSKEDAEADHLLYAKYACYVAKNKAEKTKSIADLTNEIELLNSQIAGLQAENGELSTQIMALDRDMTANKAAQTQATAIRDNSKAAFDTMEEDLTKAIGQMGEAVDVLGAIKLNQKSATVHKKETMLLTLGTKVRSDLTAVSALLDADNRRAMEAFLQEGTAVQGDAITKVLEKLKETFEGNLKSAQDSEKAEKKAFDEAIKVMEDSWGKMDTSKSEKEGKLGDNDTALGDKKGLLEAAEQQKKDDEEFLELLLEGAAKKEKNYAERKMLRANEDAAIAEAISILNSDDAFSTFGKSDATSTGATSFMQMAQLRGGQSARRMAETILVRAAASGHSNRLARIASGLQTGHTFTVVMEEIEKMKTTIDEEGQADQENFDWCKKENTNNDADLEAKKSSIKMLKEEIGTLETTIGFPEEKAGLIYDISEKEISLVQNQENQVEITKTRKEENTEYRTNVADLADAEDILSKAVKVLERYYKQLEKQTAATDFLQTSEDPAPPELYDSFEGQKGDGNKAIEQIQFILKETQAEHAAAKTAEETAQSDYETEMGSVEDDSGLLGAEKQMQEDLVKLKEDLAQARKDLMEKNSDLKDTEAAKAAIEAYMEKIKPGCDFIQDNKDMRDTNRATEKTALEKAETLIKDTPAYKKAVAKSEDKCKDKCKMDTTSLSCKVCMSGHSQDDYCGKHPGTAGCK